MPRLHGLGKFIPHLESQIRFAKVDAAIMSAARRLKAKRGSAIAALGKTEAEIRFSRLESEWRTAKADLDRAKTELKEVEKTVEFYNDRIPATRDEMEREGCELMP